MAAAGNAVRARLGPAVLRAIREVAAGPGAFCQSFMIVLPFDGSSAFAVAIRAPSLAVLELTACPLRGSSRAHDIYATIHSAIGAMGARIRNDAS